MDHAPWFERLVTSPNPLALVSNELWRTWVGTLAGTPYTQRTIANLAAELNLSWPVARRHERVVDHLHTHPALRSGGHGVTGKKARVILLCVAHLADLQEKMNGAKAKELEPRADYNRASDIFEPISTESRPPKSPLTCAELLKFVMGELDERQRLVIRRRLGIDCDAETLGAIGTSLGVSRERVRQIEAKALSKLRGNPALTGERITASILAEGPTIWNALAGADGVVRRTESDSHHEAALASEHRLCLWLLGKRPTELLDSIGQRVGDGWLSRETDRYEVDRALHALEHEHRFSLPVEAEFVARAINCSVSAVRRATALAEGMREYGGYICRGPVQSRVRRAIWLHRLLAHEQDQESVGTRELVRRHNILRPNEQCSIRDADIVLVSHNHLFLSMGKDAWRALGGRPLAEEAETQEPSSEPDGEAAETTDESICGYLRQIFLTLGPLHMTDIDREFAAKTQGRYALSGMRALLITSGRFGRLAPGVYALAEQVEDEQIRAQARRLLLNEESCSQYVRARYAGEPQNAFPLWDQQMEAEWLTWAKLAASPALHQSLMWIVSHRGRYLLDEEMQPLIDRFLPPLGDLLPALGAAMSREAIGWVGINRLLRRRQNDKTTLNVLAVLVGLGVVQASEDWRAAHRTTGRAPVAYHRLAAEMHALGRLTWHSELGASLRSELRLAARENHGWVAGSALLKMVVDEAPVNAGKISESKVILLAVQLGILMAQADGRVDPREEATIVRYATRGSTDVRLARDIELLVSNTRGNVPSVASLKESARELKPSQRLEIFNFLFEVASADGRFCEREESFLRQTQDLLEVPLTAIADLKASAAGVQLRGDDSVVSDVDRMLDFLLG